jgi:hypothetical protein
MFLKTSSRRIDLNKTDRGQHQPTNPESLFGTFPFSLLNPIYRRTTMKLAMRTLLTCTTVAAFAGQTSAAIVVDASAGFHNGTGSGEDTDLSGSTRTVVASTDLSGFNANGSDKLVVYIGAEGSSSGYAQVTGITYGGAALTQIIASPEIQSNKFNSLWYLDNVAVTGDFVVTFATSSKDLGFAAYALSGTKAGFNDAVDGGGSDTIALTSTTADEFAIVGMTRNAFDNTAGEGEVGIQSPLDELFYQGSGDSSSGVGSDTLGAAGVYEFTIYDNAGGVGSILGATFQAVPEPGSLALLGLGGLLIARRRRSA